MQSNTLKCYMRASLLCVIGFGANLYASSAISQVMSGDSFFSAEWTDKIGNWGRPDGDAYYLHTTYGSTGLITLPSGRLGLEGDLTFGLNYNDDVSRMFGTFSPTNWLEGSFLYSFFEPEHLLNENLGNKVDRAGAVKLRLLPETKLFPSVAVGVADILGTGVQSSEFLAASKRVGPFDATIGLGWGELAGDGDFSNPLIEIDDRFRYRSAGNGEGALITDLFSGSSVGVFGGLNVNTFIPGLSLQIEYDPRLYSGNSFESAYAVDSQINLGATYSFGDSQIHASWQRGNTFALGFNSNLQLNKNFGFSTRDYYSNLSVSDELRAINKQLDLALENGDMKRAMILRIERAKLSAEAIQKSLESNNIGVVSVEAYGSSGLMAIVQNNDFVNVSDMIKLALNIMDFYSPESVEKLSVVVSKSRDPLSAITVNRDDVRNLDQLELSDLDGLDLDLSVLEHVRKELFVKQQEGTSFTFGITPRLTSIYGYSDQFASAQLGVVGEVEAFLSDNTKIAGSLGVALWDNFETLTARSDSEIERVRSRQVEYMQGREVLYLPVLYANHSWSPTKNWLAGLSAGYLESGFAGVSGEVLWAPSDSPLALGVDLNYVAQRAPSNDQYAWAPSYELESYRTWTGHATLYGIAPEIESLGLSNIDFSLSAGRYLAGDFGGTLEVGKTFNNGTRVSVFATLTDVSSEEFGEGGFDKGITVSMPIDIFTGKKTRKRRGVTYRPISGDGGAKLSRPEPLYDRWRYDNSWSIVRGW